MTVETWCRSYAQAIPPTHPVFSYHNHSTLNPILTSNEFRDRSTLISSSPRWSSIQIPAGRLQTQNLRFKFQNFQVQGSRSKTKKVSWVSQTNSKSRFELQARFKPSSKPTAMSWVSGKTREPIWPLKLDLFAVSWGDAVWHCLQRPRTSTYRRCWRKRRLLGRSLLHGKYWVYAQVNNSKLAKLVVLDEDLKIYQQSPYQYNYQSVEHSC